MEKADWSFGALSPSELALLNGERFAPKGTLMDKTGLLHMALDVSAKHLARTLLLVAVLANEQTGSVRLEVRQKSALLGLTKSQSLYADPGSVVAAWPAYSLEAQMRSLVEQLYAQKRNDMETLVHTLLQHDTDNPWQSLIERVKDGLARRGLLQAQDKARPMAAKKVQYILLPATAELASRQPTAPLERWLADGEHQRSQIFKLLAGQIESGLKRRVSQSTSV